MTKAQAMALAKKKWGQRAAVRDDREASTVAQRTESSALLKEHRAQKPSGLQPLNDIARAAYREHYRAWRTREGELLHAALSYRFSVGRIDEYFGAFCIEGQGDTWEEACHKAGLLPPR